ncbi:MAG: hypothetical protein WCJ30_07465 [Deltaproteobacteria bacterium]
MMQPQYRHDCERCVFLGTFSYEKDMENGFALPSEVDVYLCPTEDLRGPKLIARHSGRDKDYSTVLAQRLTGLLSRPEGEAWRRATPLAEVLVEALQRARAKGLVRDQPMMA